MKTLALYNIKGGVGKTSAAVNLAYLAGSDGGRTLLWDLDPQGAAPYTFRIKPKVKGGGRRILRRKRVIDSLVKGTDFDGLDLAWIKANITIPRIKLIMDKLLVVNEIEVPKLVPFVRELIKVIPTPKEEGSESIGTSSSSPTRNTH